MKIGFIGAGNVAQTYARYFLAAGHDVVLSNSRGPESLGEVIQALGQRARAGTVQDAASQEFVILCVRWEHAKQALSEVADWKGRLLIDATNVTPGTNLNGKASGEVIAGYAAGARVIKALNTLVVGWMPAPSETGHKLVLFMSGDDGVAKKKLEDLLESSGFAAVDLGGLTESGRLQDFGGPLSGLQMNLVKRMKS